MSRSNRLSLAFAPRAVSERRCGSGHGPRTGGGFSFLFAGLVAASGAGWIRALWLAPRGVYLALAAFSMLCSYNAVLRILRKHLNWLELAPGLRLIPKAEIDGFVTLTSLLITAGGLTLIAPAEPLVALAIGGNVVVGFMIVDMSRRLRRTEVSVGGTTFNLVNADIYGVLRALLLWQIRCLLIALAFAILKRL
jgi:hypothetical protein